MGKIGSQSCYNRAKVVVFWEKMVVIEQSCCIRAKVVVFGQKWHYSGKVVVFGQKLYYSGKSGSIRAKWL